MQILWSRAAQARSSCRCTSYLHSAGTAARRVTAAAPKRRLRLGDMFTACYSSILASAAIADAGIKDERRRAWDKLIAEAKAEIHTQDNIWVPQVQQDEVPDASKPPPEDAGWKSSLKLDAILNIGGAPVPPIPTPSIWLRDLPDIVVLGLQKGFRAQTEQAPDDPQALDNTQEPIQIPAAEKMSDSSIEIPSQGGGLGLAAASIEKPWASEPDFVPRQPKTPLHLLKMEDMVAKLVDNLLGNVNRLGQTHPDYQQSLRLARAIARMKSGSVPCPHFSWTGLTTVTEDQNRLTEALDSLCIKAGRRGYSLTLLILKICHHLLASQSPPSIEMYNVLLYHFTKMRAYDLGQIVVDSFFRDSKFAPSLKTVCLFIDHFSASDNEQRLQSFIRTMNGNKSGMRIRKRAVASLADPEIAAWASTREVVERHGYLVETISMNSEIINKLIHACLKLGNLDHARRFALIAFKRGQKLEEESLRNIIMISLKQQRYGQCNWLLHYILTIWSEGRISLVLDLSNTLIRWAIYRLISLRKYVLDFVEPDGSIKGLLRHLRIEALNRQVDKSAELVQSLKGCFNEQLSKNNWQRRVETGVQILQDAENVRHLEIRTQARQSRFDRLDALGMIETQLSQTEFQIRQADESLVGISLRRLPEDWESWGRHYKRMVPHVNYIERSDILFRLWRGYKAGCALEDYIRSEPLMRRLFHAPPELCQRWLDARQALVDSARELEQRINSNSTRRRRFGSPCMKITTKHSCPVQRQEISPQQYVASELKVWKPSLQAFPTGVYESPGESMKTCRGRRYKSA